MVVAAPFPGQAGEQQAYYALVGQHPADSGFRPCSRARRPTTSSGGSSPGCRRSGRVRDDRHRASSSSAWRSRRRCPGCGASCRSWPSGDVHKIQDNRYGGNVGGLARDINAAIERFTHAPTQRSDIAGKDLNAILGPSGGSTFDLPAADSAFAARRRPPSRRRRRQLRAAAAVAGVSRRRRCPASPLPRSQLSAPAAVQRLRRSASAAAAVDRRWRLPRSRATCRCREPPRRPSWGPPPSPTSAIRRRTRASASPERRRSDAGRPLRSRRGRRGALPPHLRRLHRQEARLRRVDGRPDARQVPAEAARQQGEPGRRSTTAARSASASTSRTARRR